MLSVNQSARRGIIPQQVQSAVYFDRNHLLASMMRSREKIHYLCAPFGFGKTLLAYSYASLLGKLEDAFWFNGENPCFLRDLDAQTLLPDLLAESTPGDLIVFDDIPYMGAARRLHFWKLCQTLVQAEREVIVCATSAANPLREHEAECACLQASQLLYSEKDRSGLLSLGIQLRADLHEVHPVARVPYLAACTPLSFRDFLRAHIEDTDNPAYNALSFVMLMLEKGSLEDLELILGSEVSAADLDMSGLCAFMTVDRYSGEFSAVGFPFKEIIDAYTPYTTGIARATGMDNVCDLALQIADVLLEQGNANRAVQVLISLSEQRGRSEWLEKNQQTLLYNGALASAEKLYESIRADRWRHKPELIAASCIRQSLLEYAEGSLARLVEVVRKVDYPLEVRLEAASYAYVLVDDISHAQELEAIFSSAGASLKREAKKLSNAYSTLWAFWSRVVPGEADIDALGSNLVCMPKDSKDALLTGEWLDNCLLALACCIHKARLAEVPARDLPHTGVALHQVFSVAASLQNTLALALLRREVDALGFEFDMSHMAFISAYHRCDLLEDELEVQRARYANSKATKIAALSTVINARARKFAIEQRKQRALTPELTVNLFGKFEVLLGDSTIDSRQFRRQKVRTLLAILALECGHELSCDSLSVRLWPDSTELKARHNLHNAISLLRSCLALNDGSCPYLIHSCGVLSLDKSLVQSDVLLMRDLCNELRFSEPNSNAYMHILERIRDVYKGDLLPSEQDELMLVAARDEWRTRVVNTLLHSARRLSGVGDSAGALQFAEVALSCDYQREDCYEMLMSLQARCGRRPAAIETWLRYRKYISTELGLDPSQRMSELYNRIINENS